MKILIPVLLALLVASACSHSPDIADREPNGRHYDIEHNLRVIVYNDEITDPRIDYRSFYKVFINKLLEGRTTTGLESQKKFFDYYLEPNRHLVHIERWILDEKNNKYVKANNIDQPDPDYVYVDIKENRVLNLSFKLDINYSSTIIARYE